MITRWQENSNMKKFIAALLAVLMLSGCSRLPRPLSESSAATEAAILSESPEEDPQALAASMSTTHGVEILIGEAALAVQPWDYSFQAETDPELLLFQLHLLEEMLQHYPKGMLKVLSKDCGGLRICLVKDILGKEGTGSLHSARGLQFQDEEGRSYIVLAQDPEYTLYHELTHVIEDFVLPRSSAWDDWESLNPPDFSYDMDFQKNMTRDGSAYLRDETRAFIDTYSMSFPREDRARIMEYAMTPENGFLFESPIMQRKLKKLTQGIREAFGLTDPSRPLWWEQYLKPEA